MAIVLPRRSFLLGLGAALAAPAIVRFESLMPVRTVLWTPQDGHYWQWYRDGVPIPGATGETYQVCAEDRNLDISVARVASPTSDFRLASHRLILPATSNRWDTP